MASSRERGSVSGPREPEFVSTIKRPRAVVSSFDRHATPDWREWTAREFLRYCYVFLLLAAAIFVPLQMGDSWLPYNAPQVLNPFLVAALALGFVALCVVLGAVGYQHLWKEGGWVDRWVERRKTTTPATSKHEPNR